MTGRVPPANPQETWRTNHKAGLFSGDRGQTLVKRLERALQIVVGVGQRHVAFRREIDVDIALHQLAAELRGGLAVARFNGAVVDDVSASQHDVVEWALADYLGRDAPP